MKKLIIFIIVMNATPSNAQITDFKPERISKSASFILNGTVEKTFPLFGPIREMEWAAGWEPEIIYSVSDEVEEHMIFQTNGKLHGNEKYTWVITQFRPEEYQIEYTVSTAERIWFIHVKCNSLAEKTQATVSYTYTGLTSHGNELNKKALEEMFLHNLSNWGEAINYYLKTGKQLN